jgi:hypothetical protein
MSAYYSVFFAGQLLTLNCLFGFLVVHIHKECDLWFDHYCLGMGMWPNQLALSGIDMP